VALSTYPVGENTAPTRGEQRRSRRMLRAMSVGVSVLWSLMAAWSMAFAEADGPDFYDVKGVGAGDVLNIHAKADARSPQVGTVPASGTCLRNLGCVGGLTFEEFTTWSATEQRRLERQRPRWCRIEYHGIEGWVAGRYLQESTRACARDP
jgi:Bacterial SH3 domain